MCEHVIYMYEVEEVTECILMQWTAHFSGRSCTILVILSQITYVTIPVKTRIVRTSMHITHATGKYLQGIMGPAISQGSFKSTKAIYHLSRLAVKSFKIFVSFP